MILLQIAAWLVLVALRTTTVGAAPASAATLGAAAPAGVEVVVDRVRLDPQSGQLTLCAVVDEPVDNRGAIDRLNRKLRGYARYARSATVFAAHRGADPRLLPRLAVVVARPTSVVERQNLRGIALQYRYAQIAFAIEGIDDGAS